MSKALDELLLIGMGAAVLWFFTRESSAGPIPIPPEDPYEPPEPPTPPPEPPPPEPPPPIEPLRIWKIGFAVVENGAPATPEMLAKADSLKLTTAEYFRKTTDGLGVIDVSNPTAVFESTALDTVSLVDGFYATGQPQGFYELVFLPTVRVEWMNHVTVQNRIRGIGLPIFNNDWITDADPSLSGVVTCGPGADTFPSGVVEEIVHQWGIRFRYLENGVVMTDHRNPGNMGHLSKKVRADWAMPLGGQTWKDNFDGTFTASKTTFDPVKLNVYQYLMGLIPASQVNPIELIQSPTGDQYITPDSYYLCDAAPVRQCDTIAGAIKLITIDQIIAVEGERWED